MQTESPACFLVRGQARLFPRARTSPSVGSVWKEFSPVSLCKDQACLFLGRGQAYACPLTTSLHANEVPTYFLVRGQAPLASLGKDKHPLATSFGANEAPPPISSCKVSPTCFLGRGQAPLGDFVWCKRSPPCMFPRARSGLLASLIKDKPPFGRPRLVRTESPICFLV